jgi:hypothetical protein
VTLLMVRFACVYVESGARAYASEYVPACLPPASRAINPLLQITSLPFRLVICNKGLIALEAGGRQHHDTITPTLLCSWATSSSTNNAPCMLEL